MAWEFKREESEVSFKPIPKGVHRVRIASVKEAKSSAGNYMWNIQMDVSGYAGYLFTRIVFLPDRQEITNRMLTQFYDAFKDIPEGDTNINNWAGKAGACKVKHEEYNGEMQAKVHYFVAVNKQGDLPAWKEPVRNGGNTSTGSTGTSAGGDGFMSIPDGIADEMNFF